MTIPPERESPRRLDPRMHTVEMAALRQSDLDAGAVLGSGPAPPPLDRRTTVLLVALGGAIGSGARFAISLALPTTATATLVEVPWGTLLVNGIGCLVLGLMTGVVEVRPAPAWVRPLVGTGLCGGFTTMSAIVLEGSAMIGADFPLTAALYAMLTAVVAVGALVLGLAVALRLARPSEPVLPGGHRPRGPGRPPRTSPRSRPRGGVS